MEMQREKVFWLKALLNSWWWRVIQTLVLCGYLTAQVMFYLELSERVNDALNRVDKLETLLSERSKQYMSRDKFPQQESQTRFRERRAADPVLTVVELTRRVTRLEERTQKMALNYTVDLGQYCVQGPVGPPGRDGFKGKDGHEGRDGINGVPGQHGRPGGVGRDGSPGRDGIPGNNGIPGRPGAPGRIGAQGSKGDRGPSGLPGPPGSPGLRGEKGQRGKRGHPNKKGSTKGEKGERGPKGDPGGAPTGGGSSVYIRWGRSDCPNDRGTTLVYNGRTVGSRPSASGGGMNYLCAPNRPTFGRPQDKTRKKAYLYGVVYDKIGDLFKRRSTQEDDYKAIPCAVCEAKNRSAMLMFPVRMTCPRVWTKEYHGYLMAQNSNNSRAEFICVDADARSIAFSAPQSNTPNENALLTTVEAKCGVLPCHTYRNNRELPCVVCTV